MSPELAERKRENSRLLREDLARAREELRGLPEVIALHTTEKCNLRCVMCARSLEQGTRQLPRESLARVCDELFPTALKAALSAAAGEPLLADFDLVLEKALAWGVRLDLVTNGTELTLDRYRSAREAFDHVNVSVDAWERDVYERIRVGARFERVEAQLEEIAEERRRRPDDVLLSLSAVVMRSTLPHLASVVRFAGRLGLDGVILQRLHHPGPFTADEDPLVELEPAAVVETLEALRPLARERGVNLFFSDLGLATELVREVREKVPPELVGAGLCSYLAHQLSVQPTGEVFACCYPTDHVLGDLRVQEPLEIWNGEPARALRRAHYSRRGTVFCSGCAHAPHLPARRPAKLVAWRRRRRLARLAGREPVG